MPKETLVALLDDSVEKYGDRTAIIGIDEERWTYEQLGDKSRRVAGYLKEKRVEKGDRVAIICDNKPVFVAANTGVFRNGAISVPIDQNLRPNDLLGDYLRLVEPKVVLADEAYADKVRKYTDVPVILIPEALNGNLMREDVGVTGEDVSTILFSSGTSAVSDRAFKAVMLTHDNIYSNVIASRNLPRYIEDTRGVQGIYLAGLAKHWHSFEHMIQFAFLYAGAVMHFTDVMRFTKGSASKINPHYAIMVPKIANSIKERIEKEVAEKGEKANRWFKWFLEQSNKYNFERINNGHILPVQFIENLIGKKAVYKPINKGLEKMLGKNHPFLVGGSAPLPLEIQLFFYSIGLPIYQGYGLTETSPAISVNMPWAYRFGSSGKIFEGIEILIADPDLLKQGIIQEVIEGKSGVILAKGRSVFKGYYKDEARTKSVFVGGWFNTEDKGHKEGEHLHVEGRIKRQICNLDGNKYDADTIESFCLGRGLEAIAVGELCNKTGLLIVPSPEMKKQREKGEEIVLDSICASLSDSKVKVGYAFSRKNVAVIWDFDEHPTWRSGVMKLRTELINQAYEPVIKRICN